MVRNHHTRILNRTGFDSASSVSDAEQFRGLMHSRREMGIWSASSPRSARSETSVYERLSFRTLLRDSWERLSYVSMALHCIQVFVFAHLKVGCHPRGPPYGISSCALHLLRSSSTHSHPSNPVLATYQIGTLSLHSL